MSDSPQQRAVLLRELFQAGVSAVGGYEATLAELKDETFAQPIYLVALGKAADAMARGAIAALGHQVVSGFVVSKHDHLSDDIKSDARLEWHEAGHPVPDQNSIDAGLQLTRFMDAVPEDALLVFLVSGGTSALVEHLDAGISLDALKAETDKLLAGGAAIGEINRHRRTLSQIKGGKLSRWVRCSVLQLLISDVPGDTLGDIGSGLLIPDEATGMVAELPVWKQVSTKIIASSAIAQKAVEDAAIEKGLVVQQPYGNLHGQMPDVIDRLSSVLLAKNLKPGVYIWGGEPTIVLPDKPGRGGRNQHLALAMSEVAASQGNLSLLVCGTDGTDGPTVDAGGLVSELTQSDAQNQSLVINDYLVRADAGSCLSDLGALVTTGPTGTNVMDLAIAIVV